MSYLIYEPDPLVCYDIRESLVAAYPQCKAFVCADLNEAAIAETPEDLGLAILSLRCEQLPAILALFASLRPGCAVLIIMDDAPPPRIDNPLRAGILLRPFSSDTLTAAINAVFSVQPSYQLETP
tara:strand:- start:53423 stop:53797 length:375 start_codon:yes stop_codon:yes gene_type:complete